MAELPKYQQTGRIFSDVPQLDFANVRESFKRSQSIANSLDRMSEFAGKFAEVQVKKQAQQFNIDNPITTDQLREAAKTGITADDLINKQGGGLVWDEVARKVQASQLRTQLEVETNTAALQIKNMVDTRQLTDANEVKSKFMALQDGMSKQLFMLDPDEATRFQTSTGALIKNLQKETYDKLYDDYKLDNQVKAGNYKIVALDAVNSVFKNVKDLDSMYGQLKLIRQTYANLAKEGGTDFGLVELNKFDKEIEEKKVNLITEFVSNQNFAKNSTDALNKIARGEIFNKDGNDYTILFSTLGVVEKAKVRSYVREQYLAIHQTKESEEQDFIKAKEAEANQIEIEYDKTKNPALIKKLESISIETNGKAISAKAIRAVEKSAKDPDAEGNAAYSDEIFILKDEVIQGRFDNVSALYRRGEQLGVSRKNINKYVSSTFLTKSDNMLDQMVMDYAKENNRSGKQSKTYTIARDITNKINNKYDAQLLSNENNPDKQKPLKSKAELFDDVIREKDSNKEIKTTKINNLLTELNKIGEKYNIAFKSDSTFINTEILLDKRIKSGIFGSNKDSESDKTKIKNLLNQLESENK